MAKKKAKGSGEEKGWEIRYKRPEETFDHPSGYWTSERIRQTLRAKNQARIQHKLTARTLNHLEAKEPGALEIQGPGEIVLDIGSGLGFSSDLLLEMGFTVTGIDVILEMLELSCTREEIRDFHEKGLYNPVLASVLDMPFRETNFNHALSVSALQWVTKVPEMDRLSSELARVIKDDGHLSFQFYPRSRDMMMKFGNAVKDGGFQGGFFIDDVKNPKKRKIFLIMKKKEIGD